MGDMHGIQSGESLMIVTRNIAEFEDYFAKYLNKTVFLFSEVAKAFEFWQLLAKEKSPCVAVDYGALSDGKAGFRVAKSIRSAESKEGTKHPSRIFLMADDPESTDNVVLNFIAAQGLVQKNPLAVFRAFQDGSVERVATDHTVKPGFIERRVHQHTGPRKPFDPVLRKSMEYWNEVLRRFIGPAVRKVSSDAYRLLSDGALEQTEAAYTQYLASRISDDEMRS
ncbi:MAG: hypothetical protein ACXWIN_09850, partial [Burkholderiaceae bacterium]